MNTTDAWPETQCSSPGQDTLSRALDAVENASPVEVVAAVTGELCTALGARDASFLIVDQSGRHLVRLNHVPGELPGTEESRGRRRMDQELATVVPLVGSMAEKALRAQDLQVVPPWESEHAGSREEGLWTLLVPVTERGEVLGLLELLLPEEPAREALREVSRTAHLLGYAVVATRRHTDLYEWGRRSVPFSLSAEIQRRLLPAAYTCEADSFTLSSWLEPANDVGGDTYDYTLDRDVLHLSMTDAMGHGVASSLTATLCVGGLRNSRRHGRSLVEQAHDVNEALLEHSASLAEETFSTGLLGSLDLRTGVLSLVNAGHVAPYLVRDQGVQVLDLPAGFPLGMFPSAVYHETQILLQPGDRIVMVTDGMLERNAEGLDLHGMLRSAQSLHPREATRALARGVLEAAGQELTDDTAVLVLDWHGRHGEGRSTRAGVPHRVDN